MSRLESGIKAPDFEGKTPDGKTVRLRDFLGRPIWLVFYRYAACPLCNLHLCDIYYRYEKYESKDFTVLTIFESNAEGFPEAAPHPPQPELWMIADRDKKIYDIYETESSKWGLMHPKVAADLVRAAFNGFYQGKIDGDIGQIPASFLINPSGEIDMAYYGSHIDDHIPFQRVDDFLAKYSAKKRTA